MAKHGILSEARYWRKNKIPIGLNQVFKEKGIEIIGSVLLEYDQYLPGCSTDQGIILTSSGEFIAFEVDLNEERTKVIELQTWKNVSKKYEVVEHKKGIGKTYGFLALE